MEETWWMFLWTSTWRSGSHLMDNSGPKKKNSLTAKWYQACTHNQSCIHSDSLNCKDRLVWLRPLYNCKTNQGKNIVFLKTLPEKNRRSDILWSSLFRVLTSTQLRCRMKHETWNWNMTLRIWLKWNSFVKTKGTDSQLHKSCVIYTSY